MIYKTILIHSYIHYIFTYTVTAMFTYILMKMSLHQQDNIEFFFSSFDDDNAQVRGKNVTSERNER